MWCRYGALTMVFRKSVRQFKRMNAIAKSPLYTHVQNTVTGLATIAAYRRQDEYLYVFGLLAGAVSVREGGGFLTCLRAACADWQFGV